MQNKYVFSVWNVVDERQTVRATFSTERAANVYRDELASYKEADHGDFISIKEVKVYGGLTDGIN